MLRKLTKTPTHIAAPPLSIIASDVRIVGNISTEGEMQIDGRIEGDITCKTLVIGQSGHIIGEVTAETVRVHGEVAGKLTAEHITIGRTGRVTGDLCHGSLEIESGAEVEGHFLRKGTAPAETQAALPKPAAKATEVMVTEPPQKPASKNMPVESEILSADDEVPATVN